MKAPIVESLVEQARELVEIDCIKFSRAGVLDQLGRGRIVEPEAGFQNSVKLFRPDFRHVAVDGRYADQQRGDRETSLGLHLIARNTVLPTLADGGLE